MADTSGWIEVFPRVWLLVDPSTGDPVEVRSAERQADWVEHNLTAYRKPTALFHETRVYHIAEIQETPEGWRYVLAPWIAGARVYQRVELSRQWWDAEQALKKGDAARRERWRWGPYLNWVVGFLPSHTQIALSHSHGVNPPTATIINAAMSLLAASFCMIPFMGNQTTIIILGFWMGGAMVRAMLWAAGHTACGPIPIEVAGKLALLVTGRKPDHDEYEETQ